MTLANLRFTESVTVFKAEVVAGTLLRTSHGAKFIFDEGFRQEAIKNNHYGLSFELSTNKKVYEITGSNLHPFFAGLLPEGLRLKALRQSLKTSEDDLFTLLLALGSNCIGDVYVKSDSQQITPEIEPKKLGEATFLELFQESISSTELSAREADPGIPGVIPKLSASMISLPVNIHKKNKQYLLKLGTGEHPQIVQNEHFFMKLAKNCGFITPTTTIVFDRSGSAGLLVERFDRVYDKANKKFQLLHQEDACQFLDRYPQDKYRLSLREIGERIERLSSGPRVDILQLIELYVFSYLIGNGDLHAKNISLLEDSEGRVRIAPAYDLLSTLPYGDRQMALHLNAKQDKFEMRDLIKFGKIFDLPEKALRTSVGSLAKKIQSKIPEFEDIGLSKKKTVDLQNTCKQRIEKLTL